MIKQLEWIDKKPADGESYRALALSPVTRYVITDDGVSVKIIYHNFTEDEPAKTKTGCKTVAEAKDWVQGEHYPSKMANWFGPDLIADIEGWFKAAKPEPTLADKTTQIGCHFEEIAEMSGALDCDNDQVKILADAYKRIGLDMSEDYLSGVDSLELLDALADQIVTAVGVAYMMGFDIIGALTEVNASNWSKFENGKAVTDDNGKIIKGSDYFKPQLEKYLGGSDD